MNFGLILSVIVVLTMNSVICKPVTTETDPEDSIPSDKIINENIQAFQDAIGEGKQKLKSLMANSVSTPLGLSEEQLEEMLEKYDQLVEEIEAEFTKKKLELGLRIEEGLKMFNQTTNEYDQKFKDMNDDFVSWAQTNRINFVNTLTEGLSNMNKMIGRGVEFLLSISELGKETIRKMNRGKLDLNNSFLSLFDFSKTTQ